MKTVLRFNFYLLLIFCILTASSNRAVAHKAEKELDKSNSQNFDISYAIEPFYDVNVFRFIVVMEFKGDKSGETRILLPNEYGGQYNIKGIKYLKALSEKTTIYDTDKPEYKTVKYPPNSNVRIYYQIEEVRRGDVELGNHYMVVLKRQYFHFLGETFFIVPAWDFNTDYSFLIAWNHMPSTWNMANSFGVNNKFQTVKLSLSKFRYSVFTGGDYRILKRNIGSQPVYISLRGKWKFSDDQLGDFIQSIIKVERDFWKDYNFPYYLITLFPIEGSGDQGGTGRVNSYGLFLSDDRIIDYRFKRLLAHETFHTWVGEKITFSEPEQLLYWFKEGFTDYYARLLLLRANLITLDDYIDQYNNVLRVYYTSPVRYEKNERLVKEFWSDQDLMRQPYLRGDIFAHNLNTTIIKNSNGRKSLDDLMRELLQRSTKESLVVSTGSLSALIRYYAGDNALAEIMRTLNSGAPLKANPDALGSCVTMEIDSYQRFWLLGEQYNVPVYQLKNENLKYNKSCLEWFGVK